MSEQDVNNELDETIEQGAPEQETPKELTVEDVFKARGYEGKWRGKNNAEIVDGALESYGQAEGHIKQLVDENYQMRMALNQQLQQQRPESAETEQLSPEEKSAYEFLNKYFKEKLEPEFQKRDQFNLKLQADLYWTQQMANDEMFREVAKTGELGRALNARLANGMPLSAQTMDIAYGDVIRYRYPRDAARLRNEGQQQGEEMARRRNSAFMETGTKSRSPNPMSYEEYITEGADLPFEKFLEGAKKRGLM